MDDVLLAMVKKNLNLYVLPNLTFVTIISTNFDLWMFRDGVDIFALVTNF
jgi:hypothetical protein